MKRFCIVRNELKDPGGKTAAHVRKYLIGKGAEASVMTDEEPIDEAAECVLVLGGDGTLLKVSKQAVKAKIPVLGINLGTLGYLAEVDRRHINPALDKLLSDDFTIEKRMMLKGRIIRDGRVVKSDIALNDIVISREGAPRVIRFSNFVNGEFLNMYEADAIILATATGSTGYSLSAGGPIISPTARMILMTPLAPHTINARSIIFPETDKLMVEIGERVGRPEEARVDFDGRGGYKVTSGDKIEVRKAASCTEIIKIRNISFLEVLRDKFSSD